MCSVHGQRDDTETSGNHTTHCVSGGLTPRFNTPGKIFAPVWVRMASCEEEEPRCRLCWGGEDDDPLVQPCACRGSAKFIHKGCLERWRRTSPREDAAYRCGQCMDEYRDALSLELLSARLQAERTDGKATNSTLGTLAWELQTQGKYDAAEPLLREALQVQRETLGDRHPNTLVSINNLGLLLKDKGDLAAAEPLCREALEVQRETLGDRHPNTLISISNLGSLLHAKGDLAAAEPLCREALEVQRETLGSRHPSTLDSISNLGALLMDKGDLAAAEPLLREVLEVDRETFGSRHPNTLLSIGSLGLLLQAKGDLATAAPLYCEALEGWRETFGDLHQSTLTSRKRFGALLQKMDDLTFTESSATRYCARGVGGRFR